MDPRTHARSYDRSLALARVPRRTHARPHSGSPLWMWYVGVTFQSVGYPIALGLAALDATSRVETLNEWLVAERAAISSYDRAAAYALFAYFSKDLAEQQAALYHLHHVFCAAMTAGAIYCSCAGPSVLVGALFLELGTLTMNLTKICPSVAFFRILFPTGMTASNLAALALFWPVLQLECVPLAVRIGYAVVLSVLLFLRQERTVSETIAWCRGADKAK